MKRRGTSILAICCCGAVALACLWRRPSTQSASVQSNSIHQEAYIWQRSWKPPLREAIDRSHTSLCGYVVLGAEISFRAGHLRVARANVRYDWLRQQPTPVGLALRIGPYRGSFAADDAVAHAIANLASELIHDAAHAGLKPCEFQIDFDCAESALDGYRIWIESIGRQIRPVPITITALPSWLRHRQFARLVKATGGYVLQVHSLRRPSSLDAAMTLCDVDEARRAVALADLIGVPFRVALPTYSYLVAFDEAGRFVGLSAEGPSLEWKPGTQVRTLGADARAMAELVRLWSAQRPRSMQGIIWYRLPTADDAMNWRWETLACVMEGRSPAAQPRIAIRRPEGRLIDVDLVNEGEDDLPGTVQVTVQWRGALPVAADSLGGFEHTLGPDRLLLRSPPSASLQKLTPGATRHIGWLRLDQDTEVQAHVDSLTP